MILLADSVDYLKAFLGGVGVSLTPCIYPLIPITAGYIGVNAAGSKLRGFILGFVYVTGLAVTYSILGLLASLTGSIFGRISTNPITYIIVGTIIILFGLSMLEILTIPFLPILKLPKYKKQNYFSAFLLGLSSGLVASPCLTPVLGSILVYLATKKNLIYGTALLFSFAYGMGLVLILIGAFSAAVINLPKSGKWMEYVKKIGAFLLMAMGIYFIYAGIRGQ
jgi:thiol:disulfide interchange protein DsbD